jgi:hypothetical protein
MRADSTNALNEHGHVAHTHHKSKSLRDNHTDTFLSFKFELHQRFLRFQQLSLLRRKLSRASAQGLRQGWTCSYGAAAGILVVALWGRGACTHLCRSRCVRVQP